MKKAVIFDVDGTLWDAVDQIAFSWNLALRRLGLAEIVVTRERIIGFMGQTMDKYIAALLPDYPEKEAMEVLSVLEQTENDYLRENGAGLLGDVAETFRRLKEMGYFIGIVSNSQSGYIEAFLAYCQLEDLVDDIECYGTTQRGKADNLRLFVARNGLDACWYVGDTAGDCQACREAGVPFLWAAYGFGTEMDADVPRVDALEEVPEKVAQLDRNKS